MRLGMPAQGRGYRHRFGMKAEVPRLFVTPTTDDHVEENNSVLFADDSIGLPECDFFTVTTEKLHAAATSKDDA